MRPPRFWAVGEPGELGKTGQGFVFFSVSSNRRKRGHGGAGMSQSRRSGTARPRSGCRPPWPWRAEGARLRAALSRDGGRHPPPWVVHVASLLGEGEDTPKLSVTAGTPSDDPAWC